MLAVKQSGEGVSFEVRVTPRASRSALRGVSEGVLKISLTAPPVEGAANAALCEYLAEVLDVPRRSVTITHGLQGRRKTVQVLGLDAATLTARLESAASD
ncbi:MAG TPA: DUF167 domain-containing protein [Polyangiales bacterium]|nr:DUF167 domain-containing protein [Polyangiales bacterium]